GLLTAVSGDLAGLGKDLTDTTNMAFDEINLAGGLFDGRPLRISLQDDGTTAEGAPIGYANLLSKGVPVILGPTVAQGVIANASQIASRMTLTIGQATSSPALTTLDDGGFFYRVVPSDAVQGIVLGQLIADAGVQNVCIVYRDDSYG